MGGITSTDVIELIMRLIVDPITNSRTAVVYFILGVGLGFKRA